MEDSLAVRSQQSAISIQPAQLFGLKGGMRVGMVGVLDLYPRDVNKHE